MTMMKITGVIIVYILALMSFAVHGADVVSAKNIGMELARDIANESVMACRKMVIM